MWTLENLLKSVKESQTQINDKWVPARPLNFQKKYAKFIQRLKDAWDVFMCKAEAFTWPEGQ